MSVAEAARRVGMPEGELRAANSIPPRMLIKAGSVLIVPRKAAAVDVTSHVADHGQLSLAPEVVLRRTVVKAGPKDSVATLARRYRLSPVQVAEWNNVGVNTAFKAGQQVVLHLPVRAARGPARATGKRVVRGVRAVSTKPAPRRAPAQPRKRN